MSTLHLVQTSEKSALSRPDVARGYASAYLALRGVKTEHMLPDAYDDLHRVISYIAYRYNSVLMNGTKFFPKPWVSSVRECPECDGAGESHQVSTRHNSGGFDQVDGDTVKCRFCKGSGLLGGDTDKERSL